MMDIGGMQTVVGNAGANRLAITNADDLARGGAGGRIVIELRHSDKAEAEIIESSVEGALVRVTKEMRRDSALSNTTRKLMR